jgi:hypothetical protein
MDMILDWWRSNRYKLKLVFPPLFLIISQIFFIGPTTIYLGNISEFDVSFLAVLKHYGIPALIIALIFLGIGFLLSRKYLVLYISLIFAIGILLWVQGNFLVWEYGLLDGQGFDWTKNVWRGWVDGTLWIAFLIMACLFHTRIYKAVKIASIAVLSLQLVYLTFLIFQRPKIWQTNEEAGLSIFPPEEIYEFSSKQNVIHVILDGFQSDFFYEIIDQKGGYYYEALDGFTFFKETTGSFPTTYMSVPAILSGQNYKNDIPMEEFVKRILNGKTIWNVMYDNGYEVDLVYPNETKYFQGRFSTAYCLPTPYKVSKHHYARSKSALILDLVLFRYFPHFIKKVVYNNQSWLIQRLVSHENYLQFIPLSNKAFLEDLIANMSANRKKPVYKYVHLNTTHVPVVINADCEYAGKVLQTCPENLKIQCKCALDDFIEFLEKIKSLRIYDNSLIILQADTGAGAGVDIWNTHKEVNEHYIANVVGSALPLMAIKPPHDKGPLKISKAQVMLTDTPATISAIMKLGEKFPGRSVFKIDPEEERERRYYHYKWLHNRWQAGFFPRLDEYIIKGSVFDRSSWRLGGIKFFKHALFRAEIIDFGTDKGFDFLLEGWGYNESSTEEGCTFNWALGRSSTILLSLPKEAVCLTANMKPYLFNKPQSITISVDGKVSGIWNLSNRWEWQKRSIVIKPDQHRPDISVIEFMFSQYRDTVGKDKRPLAVLFESITISEFKDQDKV